MKRSKVFIGAGIGLLAVVSFFATKASPKKVAVTHGYTKNAPLVTVVGNFTTVAANGVAAYFATVSLKSALFTSPTGSKRVYLK